MRGPPVIICLTAWVLTACRPCSLRAVRCYGALRDYKRASLTYFPLGSSEKIPGAQTLCTESVESVLAETMRRRRRGRRVQNFVDTDTDGIVYLLWPRLDFQSLTCCNPRSVRSAPRVAHASRCFSPMAPLLLSLSPLPVTHICRQPAQ